MVAALNRHGRYRNRRLTTAATTEADRRPACGGYRGRRLRRPSHGVRRLPLRDRCPEVNGYLLCYVAEAALGVVIPAGEG
jgi:hypothetical protein